MLSDTVITYIGLVMILGGVFLDTIFLFFYGMWKPQIKNEMLSWSEFNRACVLMCLSTLISAFGIWIWLIIPDWHRFLQRENWFPGIFGTVLCLGGLPAFIVGIFIWQMRMWGFVKKDRKK